MSDVTSTPIQRAAKIAGGAAEIARIADVSIQAAYQWINGNRPVPAERAPLIERATGVRCEELCPGVPWDIVREDKLPPGTLTAEDALKSQAKPEATDILLRNGATVVSRA